MGKAPTKETLIETGVKLMLTKGYHNTGLQEVVKNAGVPKGSFYHFFESKEAFGLEVLEAYIETFESFIASFLADPTIAPLERLRNFFNAARDQLASQRCEGGCLVGNLAQELADQDETFRTRLADVMNRWGKKFESCITEAKKKGELEKDIDASKLAQFILDSWEGAILRMKVTKSMDPIDSFIHTLFGLILKS